MKKNLLFVFIISSIWVEAQPIPNYIPTQGLVGWWPFNSNPQDESGNGNHGTVMGATILTTDRFGAYDSAYYFDGTSSYIDVADIDLHDTATISVWLNPYFGGPYALVSKSNSASAGSYELGTDLSTYMYAYVGDPFNPNNIINTLTSIPIGGWHHVLMTLQNGTGKLYLDGVLKVTDGSMNPTTQNNLTVRFGATTTGASKFQGKLDDIAIWNRTLSASEIQQVFLSVTGINDLKSGTGVYIFPNPVATELKIESSKFKIENVEIYDLLEQSMYSQKLIANSQEQINIDISEWDSGIYFVKVKTNGGEQTQKLIVQH